MMTTWLLFIAMQTLASDTSSPYAGQEHRPIKALSAAEIDAFLNGKGHGFAKAAELNRYPGPRHVLDLAEALELTAAQRERTEAIFQNMAARAKAHGAELVDAERALDAAFAQRTIGPEELRARVLEIGQLRAQVRLTHLTAHLQQVEVLTEAQIARYDELRGYGHHGNRAMHRSHP